MSNVKVVQRVYDLFSAGKLNEIPELLTDNFEWTFYGPEQLPWSGTYIGRSGVEKFFEIVGELIEVEHFDTSEYIDAGDWVVVRGTSQARILATEVRYTTNWVNIFTLRDGRICRLHDLYETASVVLALQAGRSPEKR